MVAVDTVAVDTVAVDTVAGRARRPERRPATSRVAAILIVATIVLALVGPFAGTAMAQGERVADYQIDAVITDDGDLQVSEVIDYDFGGARRRGIFRYIPTRAEFDEETWRVTDVKDIDVSVTRADGDDAPRRADEVDVSKQNNNTVIRIGNENTVLDGGTFRYRITYRYEDAVEAVERNGESWEEIAWNAVGDGWDVPIDSVVVRVLSPTQPIRTTCFSGPRGSTTPCAGTEEANDGATFREDALGLGSGLTVAVALPPGSVSDATPNLKPKWSLSRAFSVNAGTLAGFAAAAIAGFGAVLSLLARYSRDQRTAINAYLPSEHGGVDELGPVGILDKPQGAVRFQPPEGTTPGLVGVIIDESADPLDVSATIVDLAVRGFLRIEEQGDDFLLRKTAEPTADLLEYERHLLDQLWAHLPGGNGAVALSTLNQQFASSMSQIQSRLYTETMQRGWFTRHPDRVRKGWLTIAIVACLAAIVLTIFLAAATTLGLIGLPLIMAAGLLLFLHRRMPSRTSTGRAILEQAVGYEKFLDVADADQLRYQELQNEFVAALPYAMVFGLTERWAEVLSVLQDGGFDVVPNWYVGNWGSGFHYYHLAYSLDSFTHRAHANLTAPPPAETSSGGGFSGGSFGGGFSGGGFGGGGGGSW